MADFCSNNSFITTWIFKNNAEHPRWNEKSI